MKTPEEFLNEIQPNGKKVPDCTLAELETIDAFWAEMRAAAGGDDVPA
jgi:hypothetical protein